MALSSLIEAFRHQVRSQGDRVALLIETPDDAAKEVAWNALASLVDEAASQLANHFHRHPTLARRIGHASDNTLSDIVIALAAMSLGAVEFAFDQRLGDEEIQRRWTRIGGLWIDQSLRSRFAKWSGASVSGSAVSAGEQVDLDAPSLVLWTSGTTGTPRGVTLSSRNLFGNAVAKLAAVPQSRDDVRLCVLPLSHAYARTCDFGTWLLSGCVMAISLGYDGLQRLAPLVEPTLLNVVPSIADRILNDPSLRGLERLRLLGCGGAALTCSAFERWQQRGVTVIQGYGLTETSPVICSATPEDATPGCVGHFVAGWESKIADQQLLVRGPHVMLGYWDDPAATADRIDQGGWLATGDQVEVDSASGQIRILGRVDDVIVLNSARKIHPATIERAVGQVDGVRHALLIRRQRLELWFDADANRSTEQVAGEIRGVLQGMTGFRDCEIHPFQPPLRESDGELTDKGGVRRQRIIENRFSDQAGS